MAAGSPDHFASHLALPVQSAIRQNCVEHTKCERLILRSRAMSHLGSTSHSLYVQQSTSAYRGFDCTLTVDVAICNMALMGCFCFFTHCMPFDRVAFIGCWS